MKNFKLLLDWLKQTYKSSYSIECNMGNLIRDDQINKILEILVHLNDVSLAKLYISNCYRSFSGKNGEKLAFLIKHFGLETLSSSLNNFFFAVKRNNIEANCALIQVSKKINKIFFFNILNL